MRMMEFILKSVIEKSRFLDSKMSVSSRSNRRRSETSVRNNYRRRLVGSHDVGQSTGVRRMNALGNLVGMGLVGL